MNGCNRAQGNPNRWHTFRTGTFVPMEMAVVHEFLSVWHDGFVYADRVYVPGWHAWATQAKWHLVLGAQVSVRVDNHWVRNVRITQGALVGAGTTVLSASSPADETCSQNGTFSYYLPPVVSHIDQPLGPIRGATAVQVFGAHFAGGVSRPACRFGPGAAVLASRVFDDVLQCSTPPSNWTGAVAVEISLNGIDFTTTFPEVAFTFTNPSVLRVQPNIVMAGTEPALLTLSGVDFGGGSNYTCLFDDSGNVSTAPAYWDVRLDALSCSTPSQTAASSSFASTQTIGVEMSLNGVDFTTSGHYITHYPAPPLETISPSIGPSSGATRVYLHGRFDGKSDWVSV